MSEIAFTPREALLSILNAVQGSRVTPEEALEQLLLAPYMVLNGDDVSAERSSGVCLDFNRELRKGIGEVVFCPGKSDLQLLSIAESVRSKGLNMAFSRMTSRQADLISAGEPPLMYDELSSLGTISSFAPAECGRVAVVSAGSSDIPIAEEAAGVAAFCGCRVDRYFDMGVAGLHRLLSVLSEIRAADVVVVAAGMDGALPSVVSGLVSVLVIGLPTSIGYGVSQCGFAALGSMLSSCSPGLVVVNIDNGVGAGLAAAIAASARHR